MKSDYSKPALWHDRPEAWHEPIEGVRRRMLSHSVTGLMVLYKIAPAKIFPLHNHPHAQYGIFLEGGGEFKVGEQVWKMKSGDSYFIPPGVFHELKTDREQESLIIDFFTPERSDYVNECLPPDNP